jgi:hypothetical protein
MSLEKVVLKIPVFSIAAFSSAFYVGSMHSWGVNPSHEDVLLYGFAAAAAPLTGIAISAERLSKIWQCNNLKRHYRQKDLIVPYRSSTGELVKSKYSEVPANKLELVDETIETAIGKLFIKIHEPKHYKKRMALSFAKTSLASLIGYSAGRAYGHFFSG